MCQRVLNNYWSGNFMFTCTSSACIRFMWHCSKRCFQIAFHVYINWKFVAQTYPKHTSILLHKYIHIHVTCSWCPCPTQTNEAKTHQQAKGSPHCQDSLWYPCICHGLQGWKALHVWKSWWRRHREVLRCSHRTVGCSREPGGHRPLPHLCADSAWNCVHFR